MCPSGAYLGNIAGGGGVKFCVIGMEISNGMVHYKHEISQIIESTHFLLKELNFILPFLIKSVLESISGFKSEIT